MSGWWDEAACLPNDPELFFPIGVTGPAVAQIAEAQAVCRRCDVAGTCLQWALDTGQDAGIWGGLTEEERRAMKRRARGRPRKEPEPEPESKRRPGLRRYVDAEQVRTLIHISDGNGVPTTVIARNLGVEPSAVRDIRNGRTTQVRPSTAEAADALLAQMTRVKL